MNLLPQILIPNDFWHGHRRIGNQFSFNKLGGYYNDLTKKTMPYSGKKSPEGIPLVNLGGNLGYVVHPVTVCQIGLGWYERWLVEQHEACYFAFLKQAEWLVEHHESRKIGIVWPVPYDVGIYGLKSGWVSALVQGQAISVLARAYKETKSNIFMDTLHSAVKPFLYHVSEGGVLSYWKEKDPYFEEYPCIPYSKVLNGFISSLWGIYDYLLIFRNDTRIQSLFESGCDTLVGILPEYDTGYWCRYSLYNQPGYSNLASPYYHLEHIEQLKAFYQITNNKIFIDYATKWESYFNNFFSCIRVVASKVATRIYLKTVRRV